MRSSRRGLLIGGIVLSCITIIASITIIIIALNNRCVTRTVMIYMVGSDLESDNGLASTDLDAIDGNIALNNGLNVYLIAGGSKKWNNSYVDVSETSIFKLTNSGFTNDMFHSLKF